MILIRHELKQGRIFLAVWTVSVGFLLAACIFMFPEMKQEMNSVSDIFSSMGSFSDAFGMDRISFGTLTGFYAVECGNILGLGGAFFASLCAISALSKEEKDHTAEFLLTHPVSRSRIVSEKLAAVIVQIIIFNAVIYGLAAASSALIGETVPWKELSLLHAAYFLLQIELAGICFGLSALLRRGSAGIGLGIAAVMYFFNLMANISDRAHFLKYITPFGYADGADIITNLCLDKKLVLIGMLYTAAGTVLSYAVYCKKDIAA